MLCIIHGTAPNSAPVNGVALDRPAESQSLQGHAQSVLLGDQVVQDALATGQLQPHLVARHWSHTAPFRHSPSFNAQTIKILNGTGNCSQLLMGSLSLKLALHPGHGELLIVAEVLELHQFPKHLGKDSKQTHDHNTWLTN